MKNTVFGRCAVLAALGTLALTACGSDDATGSGQPVGTGTAQGALSGVGASSQQAAMTTWQERFKKENSSAQVQYSPDGSGAGRTAFLSGSADFAGSDAALKEEELAKAKKRCGEGGALDIPVYVSPIVISFNLPGVKTLNLDGKTIAKIFQGKITTWDDEAIASHNKGTKLPATKITVIHRSDDSGTTENFTDYLHEDSEGTWPQAANGTWPSQYSGESAKGSTGVVSSTKSTEGAITYADASAVGDLGKVKVKSGDQYVENSSEAAARAVGAAKKVAGRADRDLALKIDRGAQNGSYPVILVSYHVVCSEYKDQKKADMVKAFEHSVISEDGQKAAHDAAGSAPLPESLRQQATESVDSISSK